MRYALGVEYDGTRYCGWEFQKHCVSVQETLEKALSFVADQPIRTLCAGRTDAGVHAWGQVVHFDTDVHRPDDAWLRGTNSRLPDDVSVVWATPVAEDFHARFSARSRRYRYLIANTAVPSAILRPHATWIREPLDAMAMHEAVQSLIGEHDFTSFRAAGCQAKSPVRTVAEARVVRRGSVVSLDITANAFLQHMVRNVAGVLLAIGRGRATASWAQEVLAARDRRAGGVTAPTNGLYLVSVGYPDTYSLPKATEPSLLW